MENNFMLTDTMLWDYADGLLTDTERKQVEVYVQRHPEWQTRLNAIIEEKDDLFSLSLESPDPGFADRVMAAWATEHIGARAAGKGNDWIIRFIAGLFGLFVLTPVIVMVVAAFQLGPNNAEWLPQVPDVGALVDWSLLFSWIESPLLQYGLVATLALTALRFLDKYLQHRKLTHQPEY